VPRRTHRPSTQRRSPAGASPEAHSASVVQERGWQQPAEPQVSSAAQLVAVQAVTQEHPHWMPPSSQAGTLPQTG
jgi:hypothetical protein